MNHLSYSQLSLFMECQGRWHAQYVDETWKLRPTKAMLVGSYTDTLVYGGAGAFEKSNEETIWGTAGRYYQRGPKKDTEKPKLAEFAKADEMYRALYKQHYAYVMATGGQNQHRVEGNIHGRNFVGIIDNLHESWIVDLKICASITVKQWYEGPILYGKHYFYERYRLQFAIYRALTGGNLACYIVAVSKESPPDVDVLQIKDTDSLDFELARIEPWLDELDAVRTGDKEPKRCGKCEWCRRTKQVELPRSIYINPEHQNRMETVHGN